MKITSLPIHATVLAAILLAGQPAWSAPIIRNTTVAGLNTDAAWGTGAPGSQPGSGDLAEWNSTSLGGNQTLGGSVSWEGVNISSGTPTAGPTITDTSYTLTLGTLGIYCGGSNNRGFTINDAVNLAANQPWVLGSGSSANITVAGVISGGYAIDLQSASGYLGVLNLNAANTFSGGFTNEANAIVSYTNVTSAASGGVLTSSPFGTGPLTIYGGTLTAGTKAFFNPVVNVLGDFTWSTTFRDDVSGVFNFGGATRTITLTRSVTPANVVGGGGNNSIRFNPAGISGGLTANVFTNGNLGIAAASSVTSGNFVNVTFGAAANANIFANNAGLILGSQVYGNQSGSAFAFGSNPANYPALTLQAGAYWSLCDGTAVRNTSISSLAGAGTILNNGGATSGTGTLTINGGANTTTTTFSGVIENTELATFPTATAALITAITKAGGNTQILSGVNTYTGPTTVNGGTLLIDGNNSAATGAVVVTNGATLGGTGTIGGAVTIGDGNTAAYLAPGDGGIGTLTLTSSLTFAVGSTNEVDIDSDNGTSDLVTGLSSVSYNGTLLVNNLGTATVTNGQSFTLFSTATHANSFSGILPASPAAGLLWNFNPTNGVLTAMSSSVTPSPTNITYTVTGNQLVLTWPTGQGWLLESQTNSLATGLGNNWVTNTGATTPFTNTVDVNNGAVFYRLIYP